MSSKQVTDRQKSAASVVAIGIAQADIIANDISQALSPFLLPGEVLPDASLFMKLLCRSLDERTKTMVGADHAHSLELSDDPAARNARDEAAQSLSAYLVEMREVFIGLYGDKGANAFFVGNTPQDPLVLARFAGEVAGRLDKNALPAPRVAGAAIDKQAIVQNIEAHKANVEQKLQAVSAEAKEAQASLDAKNSAIAAYDKVFARVVATLGELFKLAGKPELAAKVRPSSKKQGVLEQDDVPADEPVPA